MASSVPDLYIAILGCGFMGTSILKGLLQGPTANKKRRMEFSACVRSEQSLRRLQEALGEGQGRVKCHVNDFVLAAANANMVLLGCPPSELNVLLQTDGMAAALKNKTVISLLASTSCDQVLNSLASSGDETVKSGYHVLRVIPSIGAAYLDSVSLIAITAHAGPEHQGLCTWLFEQIGTTHHLPENLMDEATAIGAACHALAFVSLDAAADASVAEGVPRDVAMQIAAQSLRSASSMISGDMTPESLKKAMSIPRGITINSAMELERSGTRAGVADTIRYAIRYAKSFNA